MWSEGGPTTTFWQKNYHHLLLLLFDPEAPWKRVNTHKNFLICLLCGLLKSKRLFSCVFHSIILTKDKISFKKSLTTTPKGGGGRGSSTLWCCILLKTLPLFTDFTYKLISIFSIFVLPLASREFLIRPFILYSIPSPCVVIKDLSGLRHTDSAGLYADRPGLGGLGCGANPEPWAVLIQIFLWNV